MANQEELIEQMARAFNNLDERMGLYSTAGMARVVLPFIEAAEIRGAVKMQEAAAVALEEKVSPDSELCCLDSLMNHHQAICNLNPADVVKEKNDG